MGRLEEYELEFTRDIEGYEPFIGSERVEEIKRLAAPLAGRSWASINSTFMGGGVAEMLRSVVPLVRSLGLDARWYVIRGNEEFFKVTKKFHNMLQGLDYPITLEEIFGAYLDTIDQNSRHTIISSDMVVVHDPQPAALLMNEVIYGTILWRCHIDTSSPHKIVWRFLLPYINHCSGAIFTMPQFVGPGLQIPIYQITPCIDPLAEKNHQYTTEEALKVLSPLFEAQGIDPQRPILAAVSRYDVHKNQKTILEAFLRLKEKKRLQAPPYLIFLGNTATDDPEGGAMLAQLEEQAEGQSDVRFLVNVANNDQVVGALMHLAEGFIHISTKEGFGLVVTEALWQGTPVIGSRVGGITEQVIDGRTGYLVDPLDVEAVAASMDRLLDDPEGAAAMGRHGRKHVARNFLLPELVRRYLMLLGFYTGVSSQLPPFRLDDLSYKELLQNLRPEICHPLLPESGTK